MFRLVKPLAPVLLGLGFLLIGLADSDTRGEESPPKEFKKPKGKIKSKSTGPKKYDEVITKEAKSYPGVFLVHRIEDKVYFEIPQENFGRLMLWTVEVVKGPSGLSWGGRSLGNRVVRFERRGNRVYLWSVSFAKRADGKAVQRAVDSANLATIISSFPVEAEGKDRSAVIHTTSLFVADLPDFSIKGAVGGGGAVDDSRSYLDTLKVFPTNVEVRSLITFRPSPGGGISIGRKGGGFGGGGKSNTAVIHHSLVQLAERPMLGRHFDPRVGYFTRSFEDYSGRRGWMETRQYINRFRLEKKDPKAAISEPVKPIVFYLSREVPEKWRPYLKKGVEDWAPAFEKAGFKNAIFCKEAPSERVDPNWDAEDARHSVIRWVADPTQNAMGPHVHDPRSGEIVSAHIIFWHDIVKLVQQWYFIQCGASDPRVTRLPLSDEITGECLRYVACHEVGHTLGLRHNHRASQAFSISQLRDPAFTDRHGTVASIMSYGRFNYIAQPEDKVKAFIPKVAPYDIFAIEWGYRPIPIAKTPEEERKTLDSWAARQITEPWLRFGGEDGPATVDPTVLTENISDDAIEATALGLKNLDRVLDKLVNATTELGEDFSLLQDTYKNVLGHRARWFGAVAKTVGGVVESRTLGKRGTAVFTPVLAERQQKAVQFLMENAFTTPRKLISRDIVTRFKYVGVADDVMEQQKSLLTSLLSTSRFGRLLDAEVLNNGKSYTAMQFITDVQQGVWSELKAPQPTIDPLRRHLQRAYLEHIKDELNPKEAAAPGPRLPGRFGGARGGKISDFRPVARAALQTLQQQIDAALPRTQDGITRAHLQDCKREVKVILNPPRE